MTEPSQELEQLKQEHPHQPQTSVEKVMRMIEYIQDGEDEEIREAFPIGLPIPLVRGALAGIVTQVPTDPQVLDEFLGKVSAFISDLRSDDVRPAAG